jgi:glycosyltransferase involved in cell wall biosynthesis
MTKQNTFSIVIPTYNRAEKLRSTISALLSQDYPDSKYEVIISDDGSTDTTPITGLVFSLSRSHPIKYIRNTHQGTVKTMNAGLKLAKNGIVVMMCDDQLPDRDFLKDCSEMIDSNPDISVWDGRIIISFRER